MLPIFPYKVQYFVVIMVIYYPLNHRNLEIIMPLINEFKNNFYCFHSHTENGDPKSRKLHFFQNSFFKDEKKFNFFKVFTYFY